MKESYRENVLVVLRQFEAEFKEDFMNTEMRGEDIRYKYLRRIFGFKKLVDEAQRKSLIENFNYGYENGINEIERQVDFEVERKSIDVDEIYRLFNTELINNFKLFSNVFNNVVLRVNSIVARRAIFLEMATDEVIVKRLLENNFGEFFEKGFNVVTYKDNRKVNFVSYFDVVFNSFGRKAYEKAHSIARIQNNISFVKIADRSSACDVCSKFLGKILFDDANFKNLEATLGAGYDTLSDAYKEGLFHINCKDVYEAFVQKVDERKLGLTADGEGVPRYLENGEELDSYNLLFYKDELFEYFRKNVYNKDDNYGDKLVLRFLDNVYRNNLNSYDTTSFTNDIFRDRNDLLNIVSKYLDSKIDNGVSGLAYLFKNNEFLNEYSEWLSFEQWLNDTYDRSEEDITIDNLLLIDRRKESDTTMDSIKLEIAAGLVGFDLPYDIADISEALERGDKKDAVICLLFMLPII